MSKKMNLEDRHLLIKMPELMKYTKKEVELLYLLMKDLLPGSFLVSITKEKKIELMIQLSTRSDSYIYRMIDKFITNGHIFRYKNSRYLINPRIAYHGDRSGIFDAIKKYDSLVFAKEVSGNI